LFAIILLGTAVASAAPGSRRKDYPCKGCLFDPPAASSEKSPLLVVLHGDFDSAQNAASPWEKAAQKRGIALFVPQCPAAEGCKGSYWQWDGEPKWLDAQIRTIESSYAIDADRVWVAGWSGGASYLGWRAAALGDRYAAVVIAGGGMPPSSMTKCPTSALPVYFMVGDANPLHHLAKSLREYFDACGGEVVWDLQKGANHGGELVALGKSDKMATILDWLVAHPRKHVAAIAVESDAGVDAPSPTTNDASPDSDPPVATASSTPPPVRGGRCGCTTPGAPSDGSGACAVMAVALAIVTRRGGATSRTGTASRKA